MQSIRLSHPKSSFSGGGGFCDFARGAEEAGDVARPVHVERGDADDALRTEGLDHAAGVEALRGALEDDDAALLRNFERNKA